MEFWLPVPGWRGYEASDAGRIRSMPRFLSDGRWTAGKILTASPDSHGYDCVTFAEGKRRARIRVHRVIAMTWLDKPPPGKPQVRHLIGQRVNSADALTYGDQADNEKDKKRGEMEGRGGLLGRPVVHLAVPRDFQAVS